MIKDIKELIDKEKDENNNSKDDLMSSLFAAMNEANNGNSLHGKDYHDKLDISKKDDDKSLHSTEDLNKFPVLEDFLKFMKEANYGNTARKRADFEADFSNNGVMGKNDAFFNDYFDEHVPEYKRESLQANSEGNGFLSNYFDSGFQDGSFKDFEKKLWPGQLQE